MNMRPLNRLRFLCVSMLTLFVIGLDFAWAVGLSPVSRPRIDGAFCGQYVMHYAPVGTYLSFDPSNSYAQCGKSIVDYTWNFDDGNTQSSGYPYPVLHSYSSPGLYVPTLTVTDSEGFTDTSQGYVTAFKGEILATSDSQINLQDTGGTTATIRYKVLPTNINPAFSPVSVTLKIKQGGTEIRSISLSRLTGDQQTTWDGRDNSGGLVSGGIYVATLEVVGGTNTYFSNAHQISVLTPPVAHIRDGIVAYLNTLVAFDGSGSHDPDDGTGPGLGITTWSWSFTGGTPESVTTTTSGASTTYSTVGEKEVALTVTDNEGETNSTTRTISVTPAPPVADAGENQTVALNTTVGDNGVTTTSVTVNFDGSGSYDPDDSGDSTVLNKGITKWKWGFTDGNPTNVTSETDATASTTYTTTGQKTVTLTVTDNDTPALETTVTLTVTVFSVNISTSTDIAMNITNAAAPAMPNVTFHADIEPETLLSQTTFRWRLETSFKQHRRDPNDQTNIILARNYAHRLPSTGTDEAPGTQDIVANEDWTPDWGNLLTGGDVHVYVTAAVADVSTEAEDDQDGYVIRGTNPTRAQILAIADDVEERAVFWQESSFRQFYTQDRDMGDDRLDERRGMPVFGLPDGWGLMQRDPPPSEAYLWNWNTNLTAGVDYLNLMHTNAQNYLNRHYDSAVWNWNPHTEHPEWVWDEAFSRYNTGRPIFSPNGNGGRKHCEDQTPDSTEGDIFINAAGCAYADRIRAHINNPPW